MSKPREFWINANPHNRGWSEGKPDQALIDINPYGAVHVIEYSAYESLKAERDRYREALESIAAEKCSPSFDEVLPRLERGKLISIIDTDTHIARAALNGGE